MFLIFCITSSCCSAWGSYLHFPLPCFRLVYRFAGYFSWLTVRFHPGSVSIILALLSLLTRRSFLGPTLPTICRHSALRRLRRICITFRVGKFIHFCTKNSFIFIVESTLSQPCLNVQDCRNILSTSTMTYFWVSPFGPEISSHRLASRRCIFLGRYPRVKMVVLNPG